MAAEEETAKTLSDPDEVSHRQSSEDESDKDKALRLCAFPWIIERLKKENKALKTELEMEKALKAKHIPPAEIDLDGALYPGGMDWSFYKPQCPYTPVYIFNKEDNSDDNSDSE